MSSPMRLDHALVAAASREAKVQKRSTPKQIEFWAEIGRNLEQLIDMDDIIAITQGLKEIDIRPATSSTVDPDLLFDEIENARDSAKPNAHGSLAPYIYEASKTPGYLDRIETATGRSQTGQFIDGHFKIKP